VKILTEAITALRHNVKQMMTLKLDREDRQWQGFRPSGLPRSGLVQFSYDLISRDLAEAHRLILPDKLCVFRLDIFLFGWIK
jgi:hypothetical protein